jgi:hypothetical protein
VPRGVVAKDGDKRTAPNGYSYTKVDGVWRMTHHVMAEEKIGRRLRADEGVRFKDNDRRNLVPENILVVVKGSLTVQKQITYVEARIQELQGQLVELRAKLVKKEEYCE